MVNLFLLTSFDQLIWMLKNIIRLSKQAILMRRSTVLSLPFQLVFPDLIVNGGGKYFVTSAPHDPHSGGKYIQPLFFFVTDDKTNEPKCLFLASLFNLS